MNSCASDVIGATCGTYTAIVKVHVPLADKNLCGNDTAMAVNLEEILKRIDAINNSPRGKKLKDAALSKAFGKQQDLVRNWRRGSAQLPSLDTIEKAAAFFGVSPGWLAYGDEPSRTAREIPLISQVAAGRFSDPGDIEASTEERIYVDGLGKGRYYALRVKGDSMDLVAPENSVIVVDANQKTLMSKRYYIFRLEGDATFKQFIENPRRLQPLSSNKIHDAIPATSDMVVMGRVVKIIQDI